MEKRRDLVKNPELSNTSVLQFRLKQGLPGSSTGASYTTVQRWRVAFEPNNVNAFTELRILSGLG